MLDIRVMELLRYECTKGFNGPLARRLQSRRRPELPEDAARVWPAGIDPLRSPATVGYVPVCVPVGIMAV